MAQKEKPQYKHFAANLRRAYENWHKETGKNQADLASMVGLSDRKSISNYLNAVNYPEDYVMKRLCKVLKTTPEELNGINDDFIRKYQYDSKTASSIRNGYDMFCSGIGLNNDFLKYVRSALPDTCFPLFTPIQCAIFSEEYNRADPIATAENEDRKEYQLKTANGIHTDLSYSDLAYLKEVQDQVTEFIEYLFYKHQKEMNETLAKVNAECIIKSSDGMVTVKGISKSKLCELEPHYRYWLGDAAEIIKAEIAKRKETDDGKH